ncbi:hypothetical protein IAT38_000179 [Cryptococcus sp. DSM 104549]
MLTPHQSYVGWVLEVAGREEYYYVEQYFFEDLTPVTATRNGEVFQCRHISAKHAAVLNAFCHYVWQSVSDGTFLPCCFRGDYFRIVCSISGPFMVVPLQPSRVIHGADAVSSEEVDVSHYAATHECSPVCMAIRDTGRR